VKLSEMMTVKEVAAYMRVHPSTIYRLIKKNRLPHFRVGSDHRFPKTAIDAWIEEQVHAATGKSRVADRNDSARPSSAPVGVSGMRG